MITQEEILLARECMDFALASGAGKVRITLDKSLMDLVATLNGSVDRVTHCLDRSLTLALFVDSRYGTFSTNRLDKESLKSFVTSAIDTVRMLAPDQCRNLPAPSRTASDASSGNELELSDSIYLEIRPEQRRQIALEAAAFGKITPQPGMKLISEEGEYSDSEYDTLIIDSQGLYCRHTETSFEYGVEITLEDEQSGEKFSGYWWHAAPLLKDLEYSECGVKAMQRAQAQAGAKEIQSMRTTMVVDSECASRLVTPILNALGGFSLQQKNSFLEGSLDCKLFSDGLTITDACRSKGETGSRLFDSEGVATVCCPIIENGIVRRYFINTYMSGKMGLSPTIEDATRPRVEPWPQPGLDRDAILRICGSGILVTGFNGGNSNPATGDFSYGIEGFAFENGQITHPVREMLITGNFIKLWSSLRAAGSDARLCMSKLTPTLAFSEVDFSS